MEFLKKHAGLLYQPSYGLDGPLPPSETLPTMYDLPSEDRSAPGLPDTFHLSQPRLLDGTLRSPTYPSDQLFTGSDLNLYYDARHKLWYKRPDCFLVLDANPSEMRLSYVMWQEVIAPFLIVELLSPGTEDEDLGYSLRGIDRPPTKWQVYEQILRVPYYAVFDRYSNLFRLFRLEATRYKELELVDNRIWFEELELGLGLWTGPYEGFDRPWLRWYDETGWIATPIERAEAETQRAEAETQRATLAEHRAAEAEGRAERRAAKLRALGIAED